MAPDAYDTCNGLVIPRSWVQIPANAYQKKTAVQNRKRSSCLYLLYYETMFMHTWCNGKEGVVNDKMEIDDVHLSLDFYKRMYDAYTLTKKQLQKVLMTVSTCFVANEAD